MLEKKNILSMSLHKHSNLLIIFIKHIPIGKYMNGFKTHFYAKHVESMNSILKKKSKNNNME